MKRKPQKANASESKKRQRKNGVGLETSQPSNETSCIATLDLQSQLGKMGVFEERPGSLEDIKAALQQHEARQREAITALSCGFFPRGAMALVLAACPNITSFTCHYGTKAKDNLTNPDLKLLLKTRHKNLRCLRLSPVSENARAPKLQGCGYRWLAKHATALIELEITLEFDRKQQLLPRLSTTHLQHLTLHDVDTTYAAEVAALLDRAPQLQLTIRCRSLDQKKELQRQLGDLSQPDQLNRLVIDVASASNTV
eukprot:g10202.t1